MKRDRRLHGLSSEHHDALVLARSLKRHEGRWTNEDGAQLGLRFDTELDPHFRVEEEVLLVALRKAGEDALVERTLQEHRELRALVQAARNGGGDAALEFGLRLHDHVRFEERELFPACELLSDAILEEVRRLRPRPGE